MPVGAGSIKRAAKTVNAGKSQIEAEEAAKKAAGEEAVKSRKKASEEGGEKTVKSRKKGTGNGGASGKPKEEEKKAGNDVIDSEGQYEICKIGQELPVYLL